MSVDHALATHRAGDGIALIVALGVERACVARHVGAHVDAGVSLIQCGPGAARAARAAVAAIERGARALVSCGMAGALTPAVEPGDVLLPGTVVRGDGKRFDTDDAWRERLAATLKGRFPVNQGLLLAAGDVLATPSAKRRASELSGGAVAVDMESGALAEAAAAAGIPFVVLRVVTDGADDELPSGIERWIDDAGRRRLASVVDAAFRPADWRLLWTLAKRYRQARRTLSDVAGELIPKDFLLDA